MAGEKNVRGGTAARPIAAAVLLAVMLLATAAFATYGAELWGGKSVPKVVGTSQVAATQELESKGFSVVVANDAVDDGIGKALSTEPGAGERASEGSTVTLHVGVQRIIPQVVGLSEADATTALRDVGAQRISIEHQASTAQEGSVVAVDPGEGSAFVSRDTITLTVAQSYTVPYVIGRTEDEATKDIEAAGLVASVSYVKSDQKAGTVVSCDPGQGTRIGAGGTVALQVVEVNPSDYHHLGEYFRYSPRRIDEWLTEQGFSLQASHEDANGMAQALFVSADKGTVRLDSNPFAHNFDASQGAGDDVLARGARFEGVRLELVSSDVPATAANLSDEALRQIVELCGFSGQTAKVTQDNIRLPQGASKGTASFACAYGVQNGYSWSVVIVSDAGQLRVAASCAPTSLYDQYDLTGFGGGVADMIAYIDAYTG